MASRLFRGTPKNYLILFANRLFVYLSVYIYIYIYIYISATVPLRHEVECPNVFYWFWIGETGPLGTRETGPLGAGETRKTGPEGN